MFFRKGIRSKEAVHIFLDAWILDDKLTGSIFTLNYVLHFSQRRLRFYFFALEDCLKEQNIDIFGLIGVWCVLKWQPKGGVQYLILDVAFVDDENKEYIHYIHLLMYIIFWISVTVYPTITCNHCYFGGNRQTAWTMQMIKKK